MLQHDRYGMRMKLAQMSASTQTMREGDSSIHILSFDLRAALGPSRAELAELPSSSAQTPNQPLSSMFSSSMCLTTHTEERKKALS